METKIIDISDERYPARLRRINRPPARLYCMGNTELLRRRCVCMVGSRKTTEYGRRTAEKIARRLSAHGITVVSGLALGIDAASHRGALKGSGSTIAVLGCGIDIPYPWANRFLKEEIVKQGLLISEYPLGTQATRYTFPQRNRIIAGISECGILTEAGLNSGALITAEHLAEQGKDVMVVPGNINSPCSIGSNMLLRDGAIPLVVVDDALDYLSVPRQTDEEVCRNLDADERKIIDLLSASGEMTVDEISAALKIGTAAVAGLVTVLEMKGLIYSALGKIFVAN